MARQLLHIILLLALALTVLPCPPVSAQSDAGFGAQTTENHFPNGLTFRVHVQSGSSKIVSARLRYRLLGDPTFITETVPVEPDYALDLRFDLTALGSNPPGITVTSFWEVTLADGSQSSSLEVISVYDDPYYDWETLEDEQIAVRWHDRPQALGEQVFDIARMAVKSQSELFGAKLDDQMRIVIYNSYEEFTAWNQKAGKNIGGQAFPELGITVQIVPDTASQNWWLYEVVPHEISHLYFYQVTHHPGSEPPLWLNEGVAQYNEFIEHGQELSETEEIIWNGDLTPLDDLSVYFSFNNDEEQMKLAYAESVSAVTYLVETYGTEGLSALLAAYKSGQSSADAFPAALGVTTKEFEAGWLAWIGAPPELYPSPSPAVRHVAPIPTTGAHSETAPAPAVPPASALLNTPTGPAVTLTGPTLSLLCAAGGALTLLLAGIVVLLLLFGRK